MREYKFRGKRIDNGKWVYGYYVKHETRQICAIGDDTLSEDEIVHLIVQDGFADWNMPRDVVKFEVIFETVGQFTGEIDKRGIEIYEDDKLRYVYNNSTFESVVKYKNGMYCVQDKSFRTAVSIEESYKFEVIGNIHDTLRG